MVFSLCFSFAGCSSDSHFIATPIFHEPIHLHRYTQSNHSKGLLASRHFGYIHFSMKNSHPKNSTSIISKLMKKYFAIWTNKLLNKNQLNLDQRKEPIYSEKINLLRSFDFRQLYCFASESGGNANDRREILNMNKINNNQWFDITSTGNF